MATNNARKSGQALTGGTLKTLSLGALETDPPAQRIRRVLESIPRGHGITRDELRKQAGIRGRDGLAIGEDCLIFRYIGNRKCGIYINPADAKDQG